MMRSDKCYSASRSSIVENSEILSRNWLDCIKFRHGIVAKFTYAANFTSAEDLAYKLLLFLFISIGLQVFEYYACISH